MKQRKRHTEHCQHTPVEERARRQCSISGKHSCWKGYERDDKKEQEVENQNRVIDIFDLIKHGAVIEPNNTYGCEAGDIWQKLLHCLEQAFPELPVIDALQFRNLDAKHQQ